MRPPSPSLPLRTVVLCSAVAVALLALDGGSAVDALRLLGGQLPVNAAGETVLRVLLVPALKTFALLSLALFTGLITALALALIVSWSGSLLMRGAGWMGRAVAGAPPMLWALGAIVLCINFLELPVETLFSNHPPEASDTAALQLGRAVWAWAVPLLVLALPVAGTVFYSLTHRLDGLLRRPLLWQLRARGLSQGMVVHHHLVPQLRVHLARQARVCAAMLLAFCLPVEESLNFGGLGSAAAAALRAHEADVLSAVVYFAGFMLACWHVVLARLDHRSLPASFEEVETREQAHSRACLVLGCVLIAALATLPWWLPDQWLQPLSGAWPVTWKEVLPALLQAFWAALVIAVTGLLFCLLMGLKHVSLSALASTFSSGPLLLMWLAFAAVSRDQTSITTAIILGIAAPAVAAFRETFREALTGPVAQSARATGLRAFGLWWRHVIPMATPALLNGLLRNAATVLLWMSLLSFFNLRPGPAWGTLMQEHAARILDEPAAALAPGLLLMLWALAFRLVSRAFRTENPQAKPTPFDP